MLHGLCKIFNLTLLLHYFNVTHMHEVAGVAREQRHLIGDRREESCSGVGGMTLTDCTGEMLTN